MLNSRFSRWIVFANLLACVQLSHAQNRQIVGSIKPLLMQAIRQGAARGVLGEGIARGMAQTFKTQQPIEVDVERTHWLKEPGCARLKVTTRQANVVAPVGKDPKVVTRDQQLVYAISFCESGVLPNAPLDLAVGTQP